MRNAQPHGARQRRRRVCEPALFQQLLLHSQHGIGAHQHGLNSRIRRRKQLQGESVTVAQARYQRLQMRTAGIAFGARQNINAANTPQATAGLVAVVKI